MFRGLGRLALLTLFGLAIGAICWASIEVPRELGRSAPLWPANAIVLSALLLAPRRTWPAWIASAGLGALGANLLANYGAPLGVVFAACNLLESALAATLLTRILGPRIDVTRVRDLAFFFAIAGVASPVLAATLAAGATGWMRGDASLAGLITWAAADGLGALVLTPVILTLAELRGRLAATPLKGAGWLKLGVLAAVAAASFNAPLPVYFLIPPAMLLVVFELEGLGAALCLFIVVAVAVVSLTVGHPWAPGHLALPDRLLVAQLFLAAMALTMFPAAAVLSQRRQLKGELEQQYRRVKLAEETAGVGYWRLDAATGAIEWSDTIFKATGLPVSQGPTLETALDTVHPEDRDLVERALARAWNACREQSLQYRVVRPDGEVRYVLIRANAERGANGEPAAMFGSMLDVTELARAQEELIEREARYRMLADAATDVVLKFDANDVILYASPSVRRYGYAPEALIGRTGYSLVHPDDVAKVQALAAELFDGGDVDAAMDRTYRVRTADGGFVWMEGNPAIIWNEDHKPLAVVSQLRDITARKAMEDELIAARAVAEDAAAVKADFMANMSHELRTPLTSVIGFTRLALDQPGLSPTVRGYVSKAANAGAALLATVNDILDFSKLESGRLEIRPAPCDAEAVCRETLALFSAEADAKGLALRFATRSLPRHVRIDADRLRQLLLNLVGNAVKFSERGEVMLTAEWQAGRLRVSVQDEGPGIAREQQHLLFRRFSQVDGSATRRHGGSGLGLAICLGLAEAMGGTIRVESELGRGARFDLDLAAPECEAADDQAGEAPELPPGVRVLVADDHAVNRELVRAVLGPLGVEVTEAADGAEAVALAGKAAFDLILMDLRMPKIEGLAAMRKIRAGRGPNRRAPILAFSAGADAPGAEARRAAGFDGDLGKPLLPADLVAAVARLAEKARSGPVRKTRARSKRTS